MLHSYFSLLLVGFGHISKNTIINLSAYVHVSSLHIGESKLRLLPKPVRYKYVVFTRCFIV
jgi:hypothetical protein